MKTTRRTGRGENALSRERIVDASIELLDSSGASGLTFRALAERLGTGAGALYWHVAGKDDLLGAACDAIVARALAGAATGATPREAIRAAGLGMFDALDAHPWVGAALTLAPGALPTVRIFERLGRQVRALGVPDATQWSVTSALMSYILGVGGQNAANAQLARGRALERASFLDALAGTWSQLDPQAYPFTRSMAGQLRAHDDRGDFLAGIDLILNGIAASEHGHQKATDTPA